MTWSVTHSKLRSAAVVSAAAISIGYQGVNDAVTRCISATTRVARCSAARREAARERCESLLSLATLSLVTLVVPASPAAVEFAVNK